MQMFMVCSYRDLRYPTEQLFLPGFECNLPTNFVFFALLLGAENASQIVQLRERLCAESGLSGHRVAANLLHISLHGIGAYDGLPRAVVQRAKEAGAAVLAKPFDIVLDRAMSFGPKREVRPLVLRTGDDDLLGGLAVPIDAPGAEAQMQAAPVERGAFAFPVVLEQFAPDDAAMALARRTCRTAKCGACR